MKPRKKASSRKRNDPMNERMDSQFDEQKKLREAVEKQFDYAAIFGWNELEHGAYVGKLGLNKAQEARKRAIVDAILKLIN